ncbi:MAG: hypothetical protein M1438_04040 [Deltaproteobacteria bacterium]|nr:hypothetical protein [Deltaproteobacteria bacterium]
MDDDNKYILELLIKKWELLWNHYKMQDEMMEKRRNLLWIIQAFIFTGWYYSFLKSLECIWLFKILSLFIPFYGLFVNVILLVVLNRHNLSLLIDEQALRDVEYQWNMMSNIVKMDRFIIDKKILFDGSSHKWTFTPENIKERKHIRLTSQKKWFNNGITISFMLIWQAIFIFYFTKYY